MGIFLGRFLTRRAPTGTQSALNGTLSCRLSILFASIFYCLESPSGGPPLLGSVPLVSDPSNSAMCDLVLRLQKKDTGGHRRTQEVILVVIGIVKVFVIVILSIVVIVVLLVSFWMKCPTTNRRSPIGVRIHALRTRA